MAVAQALEARLADLMLTVLTRHCRTRVATSDASRADHVVLGKPESEKRDPIVVSLHMQHPLGLQQGKERANTSEPSTMDPWKLPAETMGGMNNRVHVGAVQIDIREDMPYEEAVAVNAAVAARVVRAIDNDPVLEGPFYDDFGNMMSKIQTFEASGYNAGGGDTSIHTRWINFRWLSHASNVRS